MFRLTLVKDWNMEELAAYAELVKRGRPDFIEVKGVTYCGDNSASNLTIKNSPYHEVCQPQHGLLSCRDCSSPSRWGRDGAKLILEWRTTIGGAPRP